MYNRAFGDASDMIKILGLDSVVRDPAEPEQVRIRAGAITFDQVTFRMWAPTTPCSTG